MMCRRVRYCCGGSRRKQDKRWRERIICGRRRPLASYDCIGIQRRQEKELCCDYRKSWVNKHYVQYRNETRPKRNFEELVMASYYGTFSSSVQSRDNSRCPN